MKIDAVKRATAMDWCAAASGIGTCSSNVEIPRVTCSVIKTKMHFALVLNASLMSERKATITNRIIDSVVRYASIRWLNCMVAMSSKIDNHFGCIE